MGDDHETRRGIRSHRPVQRLPITAAQQGLGNASRGAALPERYRLPITRYAYTIIITLD